MEHHFDIEETIQSINKEVRELPPFSPKCCSYKVNEGLRKVNPEAYEPMLVSIGPYYLQDTQLHAMRKHKLRYLHLLLKRRNEESVERYILELANLENRARKCYADPIPLNCDEFVEMMLLDGCFIIEHFRRITFKVVDNDDPIFKVKWMLCQIIRDLMLLENQLLYFVLSRLYDMTKDAKEKPFMNMAISIFYDMFLKPRQLGSIIVGGYDTQEIKYLLHLVHVLCHPSSKPASLESITINNNILAMFKQMRSVVELQEFGVKFEKVGTPFMTTDNVHLFDIKFDNGLMKVPCFPVENFTDPFFRNLIAYEQHSPDVDLKYFSDFAIFMDQLISTEKDVNLLCLKGIIVMSSEDKGMSDLFNTLGRGIMPSSNFYYSEVCNKLNKHCEKWWNKMMAKLRCDYFNNPWAGVSTIGAIVLLLLIVAQTIVAFA